MTDILKLLFEMSFVASVMIGIVLLVRRGLSKRLNPSMMLLLWAMVLMRLCVPLTFDSPVQLVNFPIRAYNGYREPAAISQPPAAGIPATNNPEIPQTNTQSENHTTSQTTVTDNDKADTQTPGGFIKTISLWSVLVAIWIAGGITTLNLFIRKANRFSKKLNICQSVTDIGILDIIRRYSQELGVKKKIMVLICDFVHASAIFGYFKPRILIPSQFIKHMNRNSLGAIMLHEMVHIRRHDILLHYIWLAARALHWFNPLVWIAYKRYEDDVEVCRDQEVVGWSSADGALQYSQSLLEAARFSKIRTSSVPSLTTSLFENNSKLKQRISRLLRPRKKSKIAVTICALLLAIMLIACFTTACHPTFTNTILTTTNAPQTVRTSFIANDSRVKVNIDAPVTAPQTEYSVVDIEPDQITTDFIKKAAQVFFEGKTAYAPRTTLTKSQIQAKILELQQAIADPENSRSDGLRSGIPETVAAVTEMFTNRIKTYQQLLKTAPDHYTTMQSDFRFVPIKTYEDPAFYKQESDGWKQDNDEQGKQLLDEHENGLRLILDATLSNGYYGRIDVWSYQGQSFIRNAFAFVKSKVLHPYDPAYFGPYTDKDTKYNPAAVSQQDAEKMAKDLVDRLGIQNMAIASVMPVKAQNTNDSVVLGYSIRFQRTYSGVPTISAPVPVSGNRYEPVYVEESIGIIIRNDQIDSFSWESPPKQVQRVDSGKLMPFDSILDAFTKQMSAEYKLEKLSRQAPENSDYQKYIMNMLTGTITITKIELGMVRLSIKDQPGVYRMVPAWKFCGTEKVQYKDHNTDTAEGGLIDYMTINATDGSIIDAGTGY